MKEPEIIKTWDGWLLINPYQEQTHIQYNNQTHIREEEMLDSIRTRAGE